ncbi:helix-turn-helix transcriptional regulator [Tessaracoccus terricola]
MANETAGHGLGPTRARVLNRLTEIEGGVGVSALAKDLDLHSNTIRFHLEALVESGYATRSHEPPKGQGRPKTLYHSTESAPVVDGNHLRDLTQVLVRQLIQNAPDPGRVAEDVGRAWGQEVAADGSGSRRGEDGLGALLEHTAGMGFAIQTPDEGAVEFHSCPYRSVSQPTLATICQVHLGMMRGYLESTDSDVDIESLRPGNICVAGLKRRAQGEPAKPDAEVLELPEDRGAGHA